MNILLINHYAGSPNHGMAYRAYYMAQKWLQKGHNISIISASYSHLRCQQPKVKENCRKECIDGVEYTWIKTPSYQGNGLDRVFNMMIFVGRLLWRSRKIANENKPNAVVASSTYPLDIYPAWLIAKLSKAKLIFEVHDLWPLSPMELGGMSKWHPFIMVMQWAENFAYTHADKVVSMLPKAEEHMIEHGMCKDKFVYIPNGINADDWFAAVEDLPQTHLSQIQEYKNQGYFLIGYAGSHGTSNALHYLLEAAALVKQEPIAVILLGQGPEKDSLQRTVQHMGLEKVCFLPPIPKHMMPAFLEKMDALYIGWNKVPIYRFGVSPNKLFDYAMASKPIIHSIDAGNDLVAESGCGLSVPPEDPAAIAEALLVMSHLSPIERKEMGERGRQYVVTYHEYEVLAQRFLDTMS